MSFVMIATGPASRSRVRTVSMRALWLAGAGGAALLLVIGAGLGRWLASAGPAPSPQVATPRGVRPFTVEQLGALSGRLFRLESQALQLGQRLGGLPATAALPKPAAPSHRITAPSGGPLLPPRPDEDPAGDLSLLQARLTHVEHQMASVADAATLDSLALMRLPTRVPVQGAELTSVFGNREDPLTGQRAFHAGLDLAVATGTVIHAAAGGKVVFAGLKPDFGRMVEIDHGNGLETLYAHASRLLVATGALVLPGDPIAEVGTSGRSTGPHLHFEVLRQGAAVDPRRYLAGL